jgi:hypothetical protein
MPQELMGSVTGVSECSGETSMVTTGKSSLTQFYLSAALLCIGFKDRRACRLRQARISQVNQVGYFFTIPVTQAMKLVVLSPVRSAMVWA